MQTEVVRIIASSLECVVSTYYNPYTTSHTGRARLHLGKHTRKKLRLIATPTDIRDLFGLCAAAKCHNAAAPTSPQAARSEGGG